MNSEERREARRRRREEKRAAKRAERNEGRDLEAVADLHALCKASRQAAKGVNWKASTQRYRRDYLRNAAKTRADLLAGRDVRRGFTNFDVVERGKVRHISAVHFSERVVHKSLTQNVLVPTMTPPLIAANSANIKGRGTDYALMRMKRDLARHYRRHGAEGYILLMDFSDYFARIAHGPLKAQLSRAVADPRALALAESFVDAQGEVGLGLGSEPNQIMAVAFPDAIDHFVTETLGVEAYGRYMDDSYCIHVSKEHLRGCLKAIEARCAELGIAMNPKKTRIVKLSRGFTWLKKRFCYAEGGRVVVRPCRESVTRERRKLKAQHRLWLAGEMTLEQVEQSYQSWRGGLEKRHGDGVPRLRLDAHRTVMEMDALFRRLFHPEDPSGGVPHSPM